MDCHREYRVLAGCNEEEEFEARSPRPDASPRRKLHPEMEEHMPMTACFYRLGKWSDDEVARRVAITGYVGPVWADAEEEMPSRRKLHPEFERTYASVASAWYAGKTHLEYLRMLADCESYQHPLWADEPRGVRVAEMPVAEMPVTEMHELPHGFVLRTTAIRIGTEGKWGLFQRLVWECLGIAALFDPGDDYVLVWSERKTWDGADAVRDRIRKTVEHFRKALE